MFLKYICLYYIYRRTHLFFLDIKRTHRNNLLFVSLEKKSKDGGAKAPDFYPLRCWLTDTTTHQKGLGRTQAEYPWTQIPHDSSHFSVFLTQSNLSKRLPQTTHMSIIFQSNVFHAVSRSIRYSMAYSHFC